MKKRQKGPVGRYLAFWGLVILCVGTFPSRHSLIFFFMAALVCPMKKPKAWVDELLKCYTERGVWLVVCLVVLCLL